MPILDKFLGSKSKIYIKHDKVIINIENLDYDEWTRIKKAYLLLSAEGLGAKVYNVSEDMDNGLYSLELEKISTFDDEIFRILSQEDIIEDIDTLIDKLHDLGYAHGDLHLENIGFRKVNGKYIFLLLDLETMFNIDNPPEWIETYIDKYYDFEGSRKNKIRELVQHDYNNWKFDLEDRYE